MKINPVRQEVYKCVASKIGKLMSINPTVRATELCLIYIPNRITRPKIGKIFAFDNFEHAWCFCNSYLDTEVEVWEAEAYNAEVGTFRLDDDSSCLTFKSADDFWKKPVPQKVLSAPTGTIFCKSIKLTKKVYGRKSL